MARGWPRQLAIQGSRALLQSAVHDDRLEVLELADDQTARPVGSAQMVLPRSMAGGGGVVRSIFCWIQGSGGDRREDCWSGDDGAEWLLVEDGAAVWAASGNAGAWLWR